MLIVLAWKNIWRKKKRSLIIVAAIAFGLWGGLFSDAIMMGMAESMVETAISRDLGHIQIHNPAYDKDSDIRNYIPDGGTVLNTGRRVPGVRAAASRAIVMGIAASPTSSYGVRITAIIPDETAEITDINTSMIEGVYFESDRKNQIIIGRKLASRLNLKLRSKVVLSFQDLDGNITYMACRVTGIFKTASTPFDESSVFIHQDDLFRVLQSQPVFHEIVFRAQNAEMIDSVKAALVATFPDLLVESWTDLAPELAYMADITGIYSYIFVAIILFALLFGITNTMLMSVVDRIREFGVLLAIGMKRGRIFFMIVFETIFLSFSGAIAGIAIGLLSIAYYGKNGIDLSSISTSLESFGSSTMLYPFLPVTMYLVLTIMIVITANIAALIPALKAIRLVPSEAIRNY